MTWLLKPYPPRWRRRYGDEFRGLIAPQPFSFFTFFDIIGGAIDAGTQPQSHLARADDTEGDAIVLAKLMKLHCAGYGAEVTAADGLKGAAVTRAQAVGDDDGSGVVVCLKADTTEGPGSVHLQVDLCQSRPAARAQRYLAPSTSTGISVE